MTSTFDTIANEAARYLMQRWNLIPTRSLHLALGTAATTFDCPNDFTVLLAILRNNPSAVPPELYPVVNNILEARKKAAFRTRAKPIQTSRCRPAAPTLPLERMLGQYILERSKGAHQYSFSEDYSPLLVAALLQERDESGRHQDYNVFGAADYLRVLARVIDHWPGPDRELAYPADLRVPMTGNLIRSTVLGLTRKELVGLLKRLSRDAGTQDGRIVEHTDVIMLWTPSGIRIRPVSQVTEGVWTDELRGARTPAVISNLLTTASPVHDSEDAIHHLESLLNTPSATEGDFQRFFEAHPRFLLGTDYQRLISHPLLARDDDPDLIPDFILLPHNFSYPKILELKLPGVPLARHTENREGYLQGVMAARDQLLEYRDYFCSRDRSREFCQKYGCDLFFPRIAVIIGRSRDFASEYERRKIESRVPDLEVYTYDDILARARFCRDVLCC